MKRLGTKRLAEWLELTEPQALVLETVLAIGVMDYKISEALELYPKSKMRNKVLDPLLQKGWIKLHEIKSAGQRSGPPALAWSVDPDRQTALESYVHASQDWAAQRSLQAESNARLLADELGIKTSDDHS